MKEIALGNVVIGKKRPAIALSVMGNCEADLLKKVQNILQEKPDVIEWRLDYFEGIENTEDFSAVLEAGKKLKELTKEIPLIATFRTKSEGGERELAEDRYEALLYAVAEAGIAEALDVEYFKFEEKEKLAAVISKLKTWKTKVLFSNHDFQKTPSKEEIVSRLTGMELEGGDIAKIAVMPQTQADVLTLCNATKEADDTMQIPVITMSMGELGKVTRIAGNITGSVLTFAAAGTASAPGQLPISFVKQWFSGE